MWESEMPYPPKDQAKTMKPENIRYYGLTGAYNKRISNVTKIRSRLKLRIIEARAIFGNKITELENDLLSIEGKLNACINTYLTINNPNVNNSMKKEHQKIYNDTNCDEIIYCRNNDKLSQEIDAIINKYEKMLKKYIS